MLQPKEDLEKYCKPSLNHPQVMDNKVARSSPFLGRFILDANGSILTSPEIYFRTSAILDVTRTWIIIIFLHSLLKEVLVGISHLSRNSDFFF